MTMIQVNRNPSPAELRWFGLILGLVIAVVGVALWWRWSASAGITLWIVAGAIGVLYYALPSIRRHVYVGWSYLTFPIGWLITHVLLAIAYYLVLTPTGLVLRLAGRDPMRRRRDVRSNWTAHRPVTDPARYFKQF
jgi:ABC-type uncharacterized transport system permease subunit